MKLERRMHANPRRRRSGVTLVEMLVTLAVLLLMMALVVQIFQAATGSMNAAQVYQRLDDDLRRLDTTLRADLNGATARFTPPLDPKHNLGYFEYAENEYADNDGEDCDDSIRFTAKAPAGRRFTGRMWAKPPTVLRMVGGVPTPVPLNFGTYDAMSNPGGMSADERAAYFASQPVTVTSEHAEIIYFLRNGNLYRRVLLVAPELQSRIVNTFSNTGYFPNDAASSPLAPATFTPAALGGFQTSWQGVNDLSARPAARGTAGTNHNQSVVLNSLADLTDRHNRAFSPRFADDFVDLIGSVANPDGIPDDINADNVPDAYPSLYPRVLIDTDTNSGMTNRLWNVADRTFISGNANLYRNLASLSFPYIYRGGFSQAQNLGVATGIGWIHAPAPFGSNGTSALNYNLDPVNYLKLLNHNPMDLGDNLPTPRNARANANNLQTYWGYPTWRETLAPEWADPTFQVNQPGTYAHPFGLHPITSNEVVQGYLASDNGLNALLGTQLLPPMVEYDTSKGAAEADRRYWRDIRQAQPFTDGAGWYTSFFDTDHRLWANAWEDDLILTNVRSFDVKAFEPALADYADLGWGDDPRVTSAVTTKNSFGNTRNYLGTGSTTPFLLGNRNAFHSSAAFTPDAYALVNGSAYDVVDQTFAHEGRMPPLRNDFRFDAQFGAQRYVNQQPYVTRVGNYENRYDGNVGDDSNQIVRMRRIWDTWSTTYSKAPATGVLPTRLPGDTADRPGGGFPYGPPYSPPIYPSYPAPYPAPLRGIQIQVRVTDPTNQRIKVLTIRQDFTDKL